MVMGVGCLFEREREEEEEEEARGKRQEARGKRQKAKGNGVMGDVYLPVRACRTRRTSRFSYRR